MRMRKLALLVFMTAPLACIRQTRTAEVPVPKQGVTANADKVWFTGTSNIRSFKCNAKQVYVSAEAAPEDFERTRQDGVPAVRHAAVLVPVRSLDCGIGLQNRHLFETLGDQPHAGINFALGDYFVERIGDVRYVRMRGVLQIHGVQRELIVHGTAINDGDGRWILRGDRQIDVRDFGVVPPRRFAGLLRVRNDVTVHFELAVRPLIDPLGILTASLR